MKSVVGLYENRQAVGGATDPQLHSNRTVIHFKREYLVQLYYTRGRRPGALLRDIADHCCRDVLFASPQANRLTRQILDQFQVRPDFPWEHSARYQSYGIFRHASNRKWFALIMNVKRTVLHKDGTPDLLDVMNLKIRPQEAEQLHRIPGIYPAYHMNHRLWISVVLDNSLADEAILALIKTSYLLTE